jgi:alkylation response protein AidB-like acyl-CoA dehydrogenase
MSGLAVQIHDGEKVNLSTEHRQVSDLARRFAHDVVRPAAERLDREECLPAEIYTAMGQCGLFGIGVPESHGGAGMDCLAYSIVMEELGRGYSSVADQCGLVELLATLLSTHGTDAQRQQWLRPLLGAEKRGVYCSTEAEAGSDVGGIKTTAMRDAEGWQLSGSKLWIHNAPMADVALVLARTDVQAGKRGMSIFVVACSLPGVMRGHKGHKLGQRAYQVGELHFDKVRLPASAMLGAEGRGFQIMMSVLEKGRVDIGALAVGITQAALDASVAQAKTRRQFGQAIADFQGIQFMLAEWQKT